jgi:hypothetical protein
MPRPLRIEYAGAIYHLMNRGDRREPIFLDGLDRRTFLERGQSLFICSTVLPGQVATGKELM